MKRAIIGTILALNLATFPIYGHAQTVDSTQLESVRQELITLLTQLISQLQTQINDLLKAQALQSQVQTSQQTQIDTIVTPKLGATPLVPTLSLGAQICKEDIELPVNFPAWNSADVNITSPTDSQIFTWGWRGGQRDEAIIKHLHEGKYKYQITIHPSTGNYAQDEYAYTGTFTISSCQ